MGRAKGKMTDPPERLTREERRRVAAWTEEHYPQYRKQLSRLWGTCRDHFKGEGKQKFDWEATFRNWIRNADKFDARDGTGPRRPPRGSRERPQMAEPRGEDLTPLGDLFAQEPRLRVVK